MTEKNRETIVWVMIVLCGAFMAFIGIMFGDQQNRYDFAREAAALELRMCKMELYNMTNVVRTCNTIKTATAQECRQILARKKVKRK